MDIILIAVVQVATLFSYAPQIFRTLKFKTANDVAITPWVVSGVSEICFLIYAYRQNSGFWILFGAVLEIALAAITSVLLLIFRNRKPR